MSPFLTLLICAAYALVFMVVVCGLTIVGLAIKTVLTMPADLNDTDDDESVA